MKKGSFRPNRPFWRINENIRAQEVRVIDQSGKNIGVMRRDGALKKAKEEELDLVEIASGANPPVVKIIDFEKFKYQEDKKRREQEKHTKKGQLKEIRFTPFIGESDYKMRVARIKEFLSEGHKVKLTVFFKGKQITRTLFGYNIFKKVLENLGESVKVDQEPKLIGKKLIMTITSASKVN